MGVCIENSSADKRASGCRCRHGQFCEHPWNNHAKGELRAVRDHGKIILNKSGETFGDLVGPEVMTKLREQSVNDFLPTGVDRSVIDFGSNEVPGSFKCGVNLAGISEEEAKAACDGFKPVGEGCGADLIRILDMGGWGN